MSDTLYGLGDWLRRQQSGAQAYAKTIKSPDQAQLIDELLRPDRKSLFDSFSAGLQGAPQQGQDVELPKTVGPVEADGTPSYLQAPPQELEIEKALAGRMFEQPAPPLTVEQSVAASQPSGQVRATIGGREYDYSNGRSGGAPLAGGTLGSAFGREWSNQPSDQTHEFAGEGKGSFSQLNELDPSMKTIGQLQMEREQMDARPAQGGLPGETMGEARIRAAQRAETDDKVRGTLDIARGQSGIRIQEQGIRQAAYANAQNDEAAQYQMAVQAIQASALPDEEKARRLGEAQLRHENNKAGIDKSFGFGTGMSAGWIGDSGGFAR